MADGFVERIKDTFEDIIKDRQKLVKILSVLLILLAAAVLRIYDSSRSDITIESAEAQETTETAAENSTEESGTYGSLFVDISGAVAEPGVYEVDKDTRLFQVIEMAGGLTDEADADAVNRASFVEDGQKIIIPVKGSGGANGSSDPSGTASSDAPGQGLVNINTASRDELMGLNGIGEVMADRIIEYRSSNVFKSKEDIMSVNGIGKGIYEKIKDRITI